MRTAALRLGRSISHCLASAVILIPALLALSAAACSSGELLLFGATEDSAQYAKDPGRYDRVSFPSAQGDGTSVVYVERKPILRVPLSEIRSVTVEKKRHDPNNTPEDVVREMLGLKKEDTSEEGVQYYYWATFNLGPRAGSQIAKLSHEEIYDLRLGSDRLTVGQFIRPITRNIVETLGFPLIETDAQRIRAILSPLKDRVNWK